MAWLVSGGFLIPMPYGTDVDWATNLRHVGDGVLQHRGVRYRIGAPRVVSATTARRELPTVPGVFLGLAGIRHFMRVDVLPSVTTTVPPPA